MALNDVMILQRHGPCATTTKGDDGKYHLGSTATPKVAEFENEHRFDEA